MKKEYFSLEEKEMIMNYMRENLISKSSLASRLGISLSSFYRILNGTKHTSLEVREHLYKALLELPSKDQSISGLGRGTRSYHLEDIHFEVLFSTFSGVLNAHYKNSDKEGKLKILKGLERLVHNYKPNPSE